MVSLLSGSDLGPLVIAVFFRYPTRRVGDHRCIATRHAESETLVFFATFQIRRPLLHRNPTRSVGDPCCRATLAPRSDRPSRFSRSLISQELCRDFIEVGLDFFGRLSFLLAAPLRVDGRCLATAGTDARR